MLEDMLGLSAKVPKFIKRYRNLGPGIEAAIEGYPTEVRPVSFRGIRTFTGFAIVEIAPCILR